MADNIFDQFDASVDNTQSPPVDRAAAISIRPAPVNPFDQFDAAPAVAAPDKSAVDWSKYNQSFGELKPVDFSPTTRIRHGMQDALIGAGMQPYTAGNLAGGVINAASTVVPPIGSILSAADLPYNVSRGNYGSAAMDALGTVPGVLAGKRLVQAAKGTYPTLQMADTPSRVVDPLTGQATDELINASRAGYNRVANAPIEFHPNTVGDYANRAKYILQQPAGGPFTPESAPGIYATLDRFSNAMRQRGTVVTPYDFDVLRQQLRSFGEGPDAAAGQRAATILDRYLQNPPPGAVVRSAPGALDTLRGDLAQARGDYRAGKTAAAVEKEIDRAGTKADAAHSGLNVDNTTRGRLAALTTTDAGENRIFGATYPERQAINAVVAGDPATNRARLIGNKLGGGGGLGNTGIGALAGSGATAVAHAMGMDPYTAFAMGGAAGYGVAKAGTTLRGIANERTVRAADEVVDTIRRNSPLYRTRAAASPPIADPRSMARDAIAYAMIPQLRQAGSNVWDQLNVPYANREQQ